MHATQSTGGLGVGDNGRRRVAMDGLKAVSPQSDVAIVTHCESLVLETVSVCQEILDKD